MCASVAIKLGEWLAYCDTVQCSLEPMLTVVLLSRLDNSCRAYD